MRCLFAEFYKKYTYIRFDNVLVSEGTASQTLLLDAYTLGVGGFFPLGKHNPLFRKGVKRKKGLPNGPEPRGDLPPAGAGDQPVQSQ